MSTILIAGGTGLIGSRLSELLTQKGYEVIHLSRKANLDTTYPAFEWNVEQQFITSAAIKKADIVINLAGAGIADKPWTDARKKLIISSRVDSTRLLKKAIENYNPNIEAYLSASAIGYYGDQGSEELDETSEPGEEGFLAESVLAWEAAIKEIMATPLRTVAVRIGLVLSTKGGALPKLMLPARFGIGGYFDKGDQWYSWVHIDDVCRLFIYAIEHKEMSGFYNATAPNPSTNKELTKLIGKAMGKNLLMIPGPSFALRLGLGEMADTVLGSAKILPNRTQQAGFDFQFPDLLPALQDVIAQGK